MDKWQECTCRANTEFSLQYYGNAILLHHQALDVARLEFGEAVKVSAERAISKVVITHFNLADCYLALEEIDRAGEFYLAAQTFLLDQMKTADAGCRLEAINHAMWHLNYIWMDFLKKHRDKLSHQRMLQYQQKTLALNDLEALHAVLH